MKVFVAGASGALGRQSVPELVAAGHQVVAMTRTASKQEGLRALGARPVVADALDPDAVARVVSEAEPEVIVHQLTALSEPTSANVMRHPERTANPNGSVASDAQMATPIRRRRFPIVGDGGGVWSHVHIEDAAAATAAAVDHGQPGVYNVVDDDPAPVREWLPVLASALDAKPPRRVPRWLARLAAGEAATVMMTDVRGASNAKAKRELGWQLRYPSWRLGFVKRLG